MTPIGLNVRSVPVARSRTVLVTTTWPPSATPSTPRGDVHADAPDAGLTTFDLARVDAHAELDVERVRRRHEFEGAAQGPRRGIEDRDDPVAGELRVLATPTFDDRVDVALVLLEQLLPGSVAHRRRATGRVDDVREEDRRQRPIDVLGRLQ